MTRTQIGQALEYDEPHKKIAKIHERNSDRLNPLSSVVNLTTEVVNGNTTYTRPQNVFVYTLKGVLEICRFSRQPKADKFMDFVWDVIISLMKGDTILAPAQQQSVVPAEAFYHLADTISQNNAATKLSLKNGTQPRESNTIKTGN